MTPRAVLPNPFPGLRPFKAEESTLFFGRDEQIGEALDRLMRQKLLAVMGMSGCGKSSLVTAGMVPTLEMGLAGDPRQQWRIEIMRPGDGPLRELERCLGFSGGPLAQRSYALREAVKANLPADQNFLLVVDQFEEVFPFRERMREGGGTEADLFISYLLSAAQESAARIYIVLTMRSDYLGECAKFHGLPEALNDGQYLVPRMTRSQLQEAIENPLEAIVGSDGEAVQFHPGLVQKLLNDCDEEPDNLPLLQHLLRRLFEQWQQQGAEGQITMAMARDVGELSDALNQDAEKVFEPLSSERQRIAEVVFRRITESRRQASGATYDRPVRCPQTVAHLAALTQASEAELRGAVHAFAERGLLVQRSTDELDKVDLPHECLCLKWNRLKAWIEDEAQDAKTLRFLADSVGKSHLTGSALTEAVRWQEAGRLKGPWGERYLSREHIVQVDAWVTESQQRLEDERERRIRDAERIAEEQGKAAEAQKRVAHRTKIGLALATVLAVIAFGFGVVATTSSRLATDARKVADSAREAAERDREQAIRLKELADKNAALAQQERRRAEGALQRAEAADAKLGQVRQQLAALEFRSSVAIAPVPTQSSVPPASITSASTNAGLMIEAALVAIGVSSEDREVYLPHLPSAMTEFDITTPLRQAAFLAQLSHESGGFRFDMENLNYSAEALAKVFSRYFPTDEEAQAFARQPERIANRVYANRMGNGPEESGDGWRYRGRGLFQIAGRSNYAGLGKRLGLDLLGDPDKVSEPSVGIRMAGAFWQSQKMNELADKGDLVEITRRLTGGDNGLAHRRELYQKVKNALGIE
jgi:predicted chitinase